MLAMQNSNDMPRVNAPREPDARRAVEQQANLLIADQLVPAARDLGLCPSRKFYYVGQLAAAESCARSATSLIVAGNHSPVRIRFLKPFLSVPENAVEDVVRTLVGFVQRKAG